ncbi:hypothetical protein RSP816_13405 (plasmid) [Ralstonia solanacearum]|nr:hypothetical protein RSP816_13405 [Ralstonia solanacearum]
MRAPCLAWLTKPLDLSSAHDDAGEAEQRHVDVIRRSKQMRSLPKVGDQRPGMRALAPQRGVPSCARMALDAVARNAWFNASLAQMLATTRKVVSLVGMVRSGDAFVRSMPACA